MFKTLLSFFIFFFIVTTPIQHIHSAFEPTKYIVKITARNSVERSHLAELGVAIAEVHDDYVIGVISEVDLPKIQSQIILALTSQEAIEPWAFPPGDEEYHDYLEVEEQLDNWVQEFPWDILKLSIGKTVEGRDIWAIRISKGINQPGYQIRPGALFVGGHHAREHLSVEVPLRFIKWFLDEYRKGTNAEVNKLIQDREIHFIPMLNPDGLEYDISGKTYRMWRKNRQFNADGTRGVDLNRNYSYQWGTGGASPNPPSETYRGPRPFSEPETQAIRDYIKQFHQHIRTLVSFHSFSELILYPWGYTQNPVSNPQDFKLFQTVAQKMAQWNGYKPMSAADLYIASGDLVDWAYGTYGIIAFTFELDPKNSGFGGAGFYPGAKAIGPAVQKNIRPCLFLLEIADNPYKVLSDVSEKTLSENVKSFEQHL